MHLLIRFLRGFLGFGCLAALAACGPGGSSPPTGHEKEAVSANGEKSAGRPAASVRDDDFSELPAPYNGASYSLGRRTFKNCGSCHTLREGGQNLVGPNLFGVIGRQAGSLEGFKYSSALEEADFTWTPERLEEWLGNPNGFLPGNNMTFAGVHRPDDRHAVIAYVMLETGYQSDSDFGGSADDTGEVTP